MARQRVGIKGFADMLIADISKPAYSGAKLQVITIKVVTDSNLKLPAVTIKVAAHSDQDGRPLRSRLQFIKRRSRQN